MISSLEEVKCNLCGKDEARVIYKSDFSDLKEMADIRYNYSVEDSQYKTGRIVKCRNCGLVYVNPRIGEVEKRYETEIVDDRYLRSMPQRNFTFERDIKKINKIIKPGNILDIGCSCGAFLEIARRYGWDARGIELNRQALDISRKKNLQVYEKMLRKISFEDSTFNIVTLWGVIEHFADPLSELKEIYRILKIGGYIFITTADVNALIARIMGKNSPCYLGQHLYYFSKKTLGQMLKKAGFEVLKIKAHSQFFHVNYVLEAISRYPVFAKTLGRIFKFPNFKKCFFVSSLFGLEIIAIAKKNQK